MRKIKHCARTLTFLAPERKVRNSKGDIFLHKIAFVTLTLCAEQKHDDTFVTKELLGSFLDKARKLGLLSNYVWRAEKQANGNIHYHILTDTYAPFSIFNRLWALVQSKYGYLQRYSKKFKAMSFDEYKNQPFNKKRQLTDISRAYARGVRNGWSEPPSCQVDYTNDTTELELYLSKYMSKEAEDCGLYVRGRSWGASTSVTSASQSFKNDQEFNSFWFRYGSEVLKKKKVVKDYFEVALCKLSSIIAWARDSAIMLVKSLYRLFRPCDYYLNYGTLY